MPVLDGYEAASAMRSAPWRKQAIVVAQTGWGQESDRVRAIDAGFDEHIVKPVEPDHLETLVQRVAASSANPRH
ncbi:MAG: response regulator [Planctomycetota bacterium]